jgi:hypothetical protein
VTFNNIYRLITSIALVLVFLLPLGIKEGHHLFGHHDHAEICEANGQDKHIHDTEFAFHDCALCLISYSNYLEGLSIKKPKEQEQINGKRALPSLSHNTGSFLSLERDRGPPSMS